MEDCSNASLNVVHTSAFSSLPAQAHMNPFRMTKPKKGTVSSVANDFYSASKSALMNVFKGMIRVMSSLSDGIFSSFLVSGCNSLSDSLYITPVRLLIRNLATHVSVFSTFMFLLVFVQY